LCLLTEDNKPNHNTTTYCVYWRTTRTTTQSWYDHILCLLTDENDNPIIIWPHIVYVVALWLGCRCLPSVNTIWGCIKIGLSLLTSVSKHNMWSYYDWVDLLTDDNDNPIIIRPHIVFTDGRQQQQLNHNTTTYCVYWRKTMTT
jgi:hypothetical protein